MPFLTFLTKITENQHFSDTTGLLLVFHCFHRFRVIRFSHGFWGKSAKLTKITENHWKWRKSPKSSKMSPTNLTSWEVSFSTHFWHILVKIVKSPWVWIGVLVRINHHVLPWCPLVSSGVNSEKMSKTLSKPRGKCRKWRFPLFFMFFTVFHGFCRICGTL